MKMAMKWREREKEKDSECEIKALIIKNGLTQTIIIKREKYCCWYSPPLVYVNSIWLRVCGINSHIFMDTPSKDFGLVHIFRTEISAGVLEKKSELVVYNFSKEWAFRAACKFMIDQNEKRETKRNYTTSKVPFSIFFNALWKPTVEYITYIHEDGEKIKTHKAAIFSGHHNGILVSSMSIWKQWPC